MMINAIAEELEKRGYESHFLDDTVHDELAKQASVINNGGFREQVQFLTGLGYSLNMMIDIIEEQYRTDD
jgi:hypothetical protein